MHLFTCTCNSPVGVLQICSNGDAINAVSFAEHPVLTSGTHPLLDECVRQLQEYFEGRRRVFNLPMQQDGTPFQQRVWKELMTIDFGQTLPYSELAKRLGDIKATRAVGLSNGKNALAILVPCHRVIGRDGSLTGYAGGKDRKKWLLEHEARLAHGLQLLF